jgi:glucose-6-phosphate isomerase
MLDLQKASGLPIELTDDFHLKFNPPIQEFPLTTGRTLSEMAPVLMDPSAQPNPPTDILYNVYRGLHLQEHESVVKSDHLTYDITIVPPLMLGKEFNKTLGHYHARIQGQPFAHPEMYEVISGHALFVIQKMDPEFKNLISFYGIEASAGDKVIYPPDYGHIIVNIGNEPLVTANWLSTDYKPLYKEVADFRGMAYYVVADNNKPFVFVKNDKYTDHPPVRMLTMADKIRTEFGFDSNEPMYITGMKNPKSLEFLSKPQKYAIQLSTVTS